jgi:hypothetical protein
MTMPEIDQAVGMPAPSATNPRNTLPIRSPPICKSYSKDSKVERCFAGISLL